MRVLHGIERARKQKDTGGYHCGAVYSKTGCPKCGRTMTMWTSSKKGDFWKCQCGWESK